jgi:hypothetical protein
MSSKRDNRRGAYSRRAVLGGALGAGLLAASALAARAHTPYRQWQVYRKRHLLIVASKMDPEAYETGQLFAEALAFYLPKSMARPSRAPSLERVASLIATKQMDVAVLTRVQAAAFSEGRDAFRNAGPVALRALFERDRYMLVCRTDFPAAHAFRLVEALDSYRKELVIPGVGPPDRNAMPVPPHDGVLAYLDGRPLPG